MRVTIGGLLGARRNSGGSRMLRALRHRNYRRFAGAGLVSVTGTWMQLVAQNWLVLRLTGHATAVGIVVALQALPSVALGLFAGSLADRVPKRTLLVATQLALATLGLTLGIVTLTGRVSVGQVYLLAVALGLVLAVDGPTNAAFGAELVPADDLPNAIALGSVANSIGRIAGMSLAGALVGVVGCGPIFVANGVSYLAVVVALASLDVRALRHVAPPPRREAGVRAGLRVALRSPAVVTATVIAFFVAAFGRNYQVTMAAMSDAVFATGARGYGELSVVFAVGAFCGGLVAARMRKHTLLVVVAVAGAASALQLTSAFAPSFLAFATCIYPIAIAAVVFDTAALSVVQLAAPDGHRARVVALLGTVSMLGATAGGPTLGWMADRLGGRASLGLGALVVIAGTAVVTTVVQRARLREIGSLRGIADELARRRTEVAIAAGS